jgi:FdhD/NarQ family
MTPDALPASLKRPMPPSHILPVAPSSTQKKVPSVGVEPRDRRVPCGRFGQPRGRDSSRSRRCRTPQCPRQADRREARRRLDPETGFATITSRCSFEMVQKAATIGIPLLARSRRRQRWRSASPSGGV